MSDVFLKDEDKNILDLYKKKWNHPSLEWSGEYRTSPADNKVKLVIMVRGLQKEDGHTYQTDMYHEPEHWEMIGECAVRVLCEKYPELMSSYYPEYVQPF